MTPASAFAGTNQVQSSGGVHAEDDGDRDQASPCRRAPRPRRARGPGAAGRRPAPPSSPTRAGPAARARHPPSRGRRASAARSRARGARRACRCGSGRGPWRRPPRPSPPRARAPCTSNASCQYRARTDDVAVSRSGVFPGVWALGFVTWSQALETCPSIPPVAARQRDDRQDRRHDEHGEQHPPGRAASPWRRRAAPRRGSRP